MADEYSSREQGAFDSHLHVWAPKEEVWHFFHGRATAQAKKFSYFQGHEPTIDGSVELLLQKMSEADVPGALIVQPINHKFDHSYVSRKFIGCCLANPDSDGNGLIELERLVTQEGYKAVRFNPYVAWGTKDEQRQMFLKAGQLNIPVGFMCFKGLLLHIDEIESLCSLYPSTTVLIDHFGFCKPPLTQEETAAWNSLLNLARHEQVFIKVSAFFRVSRNTFPYKDTWKLLRKLLDVFGPGSDFPFVNDECGYHNANRMLHIASEEGAISEDEKSSLLGKTARNLFL